MRVFTTFTLVLAVLLSIPQNAAAYLDPGSGSYIIQLLIGVAAGGLFALKIFWGKVSSFLKSTLVKQKKDDGETKE